MNSCVPALTINKKVNVLLSGCGRWFNRGRAWVAMVRIERSEVEGKGGVVEWWSGGVLE
jgi:hypothetical protein